MTKPKSKTKKNDADKDIADNNSKSMESPSPVSQASSSHHGSSKATSSSNAWLISEIQTMMHGFGDCRKPLLESAKLIEFILHQQMSILLQQTAEVALCRGARFIGLEDILFLMRKDKVKLSRLLQYLCLKDLKNNALKGATASASEDESAQPSAELTASETKAGHGVKGKRRKLCEDFLGSIDQTGELTSLLDEEVFDEMKRDRELRADRQSRLMDATQYMEFAAARQASFGRKYRINKFREWLLRDNLTDLKPNAMALEIFSYLSYETIAQVVDMALLVKQDMATDTDDISFRGMPPIYYNQDYPCIQVPLHSSSGASPHPGSPLHAPGTSSPPASPGSQSSASGTTVTSGSTTASKAKPKKRKRSGSNPHFEIPIVQTIQPADILEAVRRYYQPFGPMSPFSKVHEQPFMKKLLCM